MNLLIGSRTPKDVAYVAEESYQNVGAVDRKAMPDDEEFPWDLTEQVVEEADGAD